MMNKVMIVFSVVLLISGVARAEGPFGELSGDLPKNKVWKNEGNSLMTILSNEDGVISGFYQNGVETFSCAQKKYKYPLKGWVTTKQIVFMVDWSKPMNGGKDCGSLTAWTGYYNPSSEQILTKWNIVYESGTGNTIKQGSNNFTRACPLCL
ncbi:avidin/streptavidin family protein [Shewanella surugensis]|uniref:Avidin/streptavidin family protein n=1 Tax=Shewanella surugensis TaxID=212020 RepID=A0ABT0LFG4_9GAMM|nr:avidin/streptavidin family protein [Shewanella surugensis]MCL1126434.1 avidin/streptavidin family protein [Shewanella surugensis]